MTNADSLALIVTALGGTPSCTTNAELIQEIAVLLGSEASADTNSEALSALAAALAGKAVGTGQTKNATPKTTEVEVTPDDGKVLTKVTVSAVTASIDANIVAGNIKKDVVILGVTGSYEGSGGTWRIWDGEESLADNSGNALYDVYFVIESNGASVSGMIPKGGPIAPDGDIALIAGGYSGSSVVCGEVYIGEEEANGDMVTIPLTSEDPPVAGTVVVTRFVPTLGTNLQVYLRASAGLPGGR